MFLKSARRLAVARITALVCFLLLTLSCTSRQKTSDSQINDLVFDQSAPNVALIFGASNGLEGVATDLRELGTLLQNPAYNFGFKVIVTEEVTAEKMIEITQQYAAAVGDRGTMLWYYSGHGAEGSGCMVTNSDCISFKPVAQAIQQVRTSPMKRFLFFSDSCFSGQMVNGSSAILPGTNLRLSDSTAPSDYSMRSIAAKNGADKTADDAVGALQDAQKKNLATRNSALFEQALTMSAARGDETSADLGASDGGAFTMSLRKTLAKLRSNPNATIGDLVTQATKITQSQFGHTPSYRSIPGDIVLKDRLFGSSSSTGSATAQNDGLFAKAGPVTNNGTAKIYVSAPVGTSRVGICRGLLSQCRIVPTESVGFVSFTSPIPGRSLFRSAVQVPLVKDETVLIYGISSSGQWIASQAIQLRQR